MSPRTRHLLRRLVRSMAGCLLGGAMAIQLGPTSTSQAINQMNATSMRGVPSVAPTPAPRTDMIWVPTQVMRLPGEGTVTVPAHWERRGTRTGETTTVPAGTRPPADERLAP